MCSIINLLKLLLSETYVSSGENPVLFFLISPPCSAFESVAQFKIDFNVSSLTSCLKESRQCSR